MEYLMEESEEEDKAEKSEEEQNALVINENTEKNNKWRADFILYGGFEHLLNIFKEFTSKDHLTLDLFDKSILSFILKIFRNYLMAALAKKVPEIYKMNQFIKLIHFSLDLISEAASPKVKNDQGQGEGGRRKEEGGKTEEKEGMLEEGTTKKEGGEREAKQTLTRDRSNEFSNFMDSNQLQSAIQEQFIRKNSNEVADIGPTTQLQTTAQKETQKDVQKEEKQEKGGEKSKLEEKKAQLLKQKLGNYI